MRFVWLLTLSQEPVLIMTINLTVLFYSTERIRALTDSLILALMKKPALD
jgi:hypothetical protein